MKYSDFMMKTNYVLRYILVILPLLLMGCRNNRSGDPIEHFLMSDTQSLVFEQPGGTKEISITSASSSSWSIDEASLDKWLKVHREGNRIIVTAEENTEVEMRTSPLTVDLPGSKFSFSISQFGTKPSIEIKDGLTELRFDREKESKTIKVVSNSSHWKVRSFGEIPWLSWVKNEDNSLTLSVEDFSKDDPDSKRSRKGILFISNDTEHLRMDIIQRGWIQFADPLSIPFHAKRSEIIEEEKKRGYERNREYELRYEFPKGDVDKQYMAFSTDAEQSPLIIYRFDRGEVEPVYQLATGDVFLKAKENQRFEEEDLRSWMAFNGYTPSARGERMENITSRFFRAKDDVTGYFEVYNSENSRINRVYDYNGAYMQYNETSNYLSLKDNGKKVETFPTRTAHRLHDIKFKLKEVMEYEASQGFLPDYTHDLSISSSDPEIQYYSLVFIPKVQDNKKGALKMVHYVFNCIEALDQYPDLNGKITPDPKLKGTVGQRQDVYEGLDYIYNVKPGNPYFPEYGSDFYLKTSLNYSAGKKGYVLGRTDQGSGYTTYYRGIDELVDIRPKGEGEVIFQYYKNKSYVDNFPKN
ncbi:hypothetical protein IX332_000435 [Porphyromonas levii]|nr:hypothetical protein [Porphyromonas levii]